MLALAMTKKYIAIILLMKKNDRNFRSNSLRVRVEYVCTYNIRMKIPRILSACIYLFYWANSHIAKYFSVNIIKKY
jgi:hypothetical protein